MNKGNGFKDLAKWYQTPLGQVMYQEIHAQLRHYLPKLHGLSLVQLGTYTDQEWLDASTILHKFVINFADPDLPGDVYAKPADLPIANSSVDVVFIPHILAFSGDPASILTEVDRILVPEGHMVIIGFNPISLWGLARYLKPNRVPWTGKFISAYRVHKYLHTLGYSIQEYHSFLYRPPVENPHIFRNLISMETIGQAVLPLPGGAYLIIAKKQVVGLTRIKPIWRFKNLVLGRRHTAPSTNGVAFRKNTGGK